MNEKNTMTNEKRDQMLATRPAPSVTPESITGKIVAEDYLRGPGTLTFAILTLENGFQVTGKSACASPENFDAELGKKIAFDDAYRQIWPLEGYLLKQALFLQEQESAKEGQKAAA